MWSQPPPPVADWWVLHVAASPHEVQDALIDACVHQRARALPDPDYPAYLAGQGSTDEPPAWLSFARAELSRRGHPTRWCEPDCRHRDVRHLSPLIPGAPAGGTAPRRRRGADY
ncbi:hypothetical protein SAMN05421748_11497 [Paractinoplanes atraurantiacus]|uniref:Uncharacterized protein n=1 Tax=Paractinoplanes atraurantiacus TaxID=1036182 RepID=A0A285J0L4_9ACTN|nr:hypothetical protein SAMN05421748_11497 [Actinoplanes atraurantiacus]